jgi:hypothetical protein
MSGTVFAKINGLVVIMQLCKSNDFGKEFYLWALPWKRETTGCDYAIVQEY